MMLVRSRPFRGGRRHNLVGLRQWLNASWCHFMMICGENMRMATLSNISSHAFRLNSQDGYLVLGITLSMLQGKANHEGKEYFGVVLRNKDVEACPVSSLAFYLFEQRMVRMREIRGFGTDCALVNETNVLLICSAHVFIFLSQV